MFEPMSVSRRLAWIPLFAAAVVAPAMDQTASEEYIRELAQLQEMERTSPTGQARDTSVFQVGLQVDDLRRLVVTDRFGQGTVYHYVTFRIRNSIGDSIGAELPFVSRYNEVLAQIAKEYRGVEVEGNALVVATETEDDRLNTVLDRSELAAHARNLQITVTAYDENGTRVDTLDAVHDGGQDLFSFDDAGRREVAVDYGLIRKRIEELHHRRFWLPSEIASKSLPPYDPSRTDAEGVAEGELFGVAIFDRLDTEGDRWTIELRGLSNRVRKHVPVHSREQISDYVSSRVVRRMYTVSFLRHGDEYARDLDAWTRLDEGWDWDETFQHLDLRRHIAMAVYFLDNIADAQNRPQPEVLEQFRTYYREMKEAHPELPELKLGE
jgi:hypothetical protein